MRSLTGPPLRRAVAASALAASVALAWACAADLPHQPTRSATVILEYTPPSLEVASPPPDNLAMCYHHFAPANLSVFTSWGLQGRLSPLGNLEGRFGMLLTDVPVGVNVWVAVLDITWCAQGQPMALGGLRVDGVLLTTVVEIPDGRAALRFSVNADGRVEP